MKVTSVTRFKMREGDQGLEFWLSENTPTVFVGTMLKPKGAEMADVYIGGENGSHSTMTRDDARQLAAILLHFAGTGELKEALLPSEELLDVCERLIDIDAVRCNISPELLHGAREAIAKAQALLPDESS